MPETTRAQLATRFGHFSLPVTDRVSSLGTSRTYPARYTFFSQGEGVEDVLYLEHGLVKLVRGNQDGREERIIGLRADGWVIGAAAAILDEPYVATAVTVVPSRIARVAATEFRRRLQTDHELSAAVHRMHAREVYNELTQVTESSISARSRLEHLLRNLASLEPPKGSGEIHVQMPLRQWEVAQIVGVAPPYLCQLMAEMEEDGILRRERGAVVLTLQGRDHTIALSNAPIANGGLSASAMASGAPNHPLAAGRSAEAPPR